MNKYMYVNKNKQEYNIIQPIAEKVPPSDFNFLFSFENYVPRPILQCVPAHFKQEHAVLANEYYSNI